MAKTIDKLAPVFDTVVKGGRVIDPAAWQPHERFDGPSFWGHERLHLEPELRQRMREIRMDAAARGLRAPVGPGD